MKEKLDMSYTAFFITLNPNPSEKKLPLVIDTPN